MFHIPSHAHCLIGVDVIQPVLSHNVVCLLLVGVECRGLQSELVVFVGCVVERCRTEDCAEEVAFPSVEIHLELLDVFQGSEACLAVAGGELVLVACDVSDEAQA